MHVFAVFYQAGESIDTFDGPDSLVFTLKILWDSRHSSKTIWLNRAGDRKLPSHRNTEMPKRKMGGLLTFTALREYQGKVLNGLPTSMPDSRDHR